MIIGVTGPMQSGKQELGHVWTALGFRFVDLNVFVDEVHLRDRQGLYAELGLMPHLDEQGRETLGYYQMLADVDGLHARAQAHELEYVTERLAEVLEDIDEEERIVLSWGYTYQLMQRGLGLNHMFVFQSEMTAWCERIRRAFQRLGREGNLPDNQEIMEFALKLELSPSTVLDAVKGHMPQKHSIIETGTCDWGEANLRAELARLDW